MTNDQAIILAIAEAKLAPAHGDVPVGAVVLHNNQVIARAHNEKELTKDPTSHAEILALRRASIHLDSWYLNECTLVVTLEPCIMCAGALVNSRVSKLVFGAFDPKGGACGSIYNLCSDKQLNHQLEVVGGIFQKKCGLLLKDFFRNLRK